MIPMCYHAFLRAESIASFIGHDPFIKIAFLSPAAILAFASILCAFLLFLQPSHFLLLLAKVAEMWVAGIGNLGQEDRPASGD